MKLFLKFAKLKNLVLRIPSFSLPTQIIILQDPDVLHLSWCEFLRAAVANN